MTGRRDGEHDQQQDQGHKKTSHENGGNLFRSVGESANLGRLEGCAGTGLWRASTAGTG
jgi:hypothetical protein